jgi:cysteine desulfurase
MRHIYLDYNATTPVAPSVQEAMAPFLTQHFGNPSSSHALGRACHEAVNDARAKLASLLVCDPDEVIFTSGGTESNNAALKGVLLRQPPSEGGHLVISAFEHPAIREPAMFLQRLGYQVTVVPCNGQGIVEPDAVEAALRPDTLLVSIMHANNEIGTVQPLRAISKVCRAHEVLFHTDAAQSVGKIRTAVQELGVDLLTVAGHKLYAPKGVGVLFVRQGVILESLLHGAGHESGLRAGPENVPYIVGLGQAAKLTHKALDDSTVRLASLRDRLLKQLREGIPELCASTGAACHSSVTRMSETLEAIGLPAEKARGTIRLSVGWYTSEEEIDLAAGKLIGAWEDLSRP